MLDQRAAYVPDSDDGDVANRVKFEVGTCCLLKPRRILSISLTHALCMLWVCPVEIMKAILARSSDNSVNMTLVEIETLIHDKTSFAHHLRCRYTCIRADHTEGDRGEGEGTRLSCPNLQGVCF